MYVAYSRRAGRARVLPFRGQCHSRNPKSLSSPAVIVLAAVDRSPRAASFPPVLDRGSGTLLRAMDGDDYSRALLLASSAHLRPADPYASRGPSTHPAPPRRTGTVKFFNSSVRDQHSRVRANLAPSPLLRLGLAPQKGFGFVLDGRGIEELGGQEVFCHYSAIAGKGGFRSLAEVRIPRG